MPHLCASSIIAAVKSACARGSPPLTVIPPSVPKNTLSRSHNLTTSPAVFFSPTICRAPPGHTALTSLCQNLKSLFHSIPFLPDLQPNLFMHSPHPIHFDLLHDGSRKKLWLSGLAHQRHRRGQPFRKTAVLIPGPSWTEKSMHCIPQPLPEDFCKAQEFSLL